jgi:hypothetical protein
MKTVCYVACILTGLLFSINIYAQDYTLIAEFETADSNFTTDRLGRIYTYSSGNLIRFSPAGKKEQVFSVYNRGEVGYLDTTDPLKIMIFYPDHGDVSILDAGFSENVSFRLPDLGYPLAQVICVSPRIGYWLYDPAQRKLIKLNDQLNVVAESTFLDRVADLPADPTGLIDSGNWLILEVPGLGLMIFDQYGTYFKTIHTGKLISFQVLEGRILTYDGEVLRRIGINNGITEQMVLPEDVDAEGVRVVEGRIIIRSLNRILVYSYK